MADEGALQEAVDAAVADESVRKVEVEITHKHEGGTSSTMWTIGVLVVLVLAGALVYAADSVSELAGGGSGAPECGDGIDNDGGGQMDADDPDCYENPELWKGYNPERRETSASNDGPGRP